MSGMQVIDWSEGGRTEVLHVKRIFGKEHPSGPHQVAALMRRSTPLINASCWNPNIIINTTISGGINGIESRRRPGKELGLQLQSQLLRTRRM